MRRRALILVEGGPWGCGLLCVQAAQRLGLHPITLSADATGNQYLVTEGTEAIRVDTSDLDALIRECSRLRTIYDIAGIMGRSMFYATVGRLCRHFDLPGPNPESIERCCDKFTQRQLLAEAGVPMPAYRLATSARDVERSAAEIGLPVILKPTVDGGSTGVRLCRNADEVAEHTAHLLDGEYTWRSSPMILVEEFAEGRHYEADLMGNEVIAIGTGDFGPLPYFVYREWAYPALLTDDEHERIVNVSRSCLRALDLGWGATNIELRWTKRGPVVIEVNPRMGGTPVPQLVHLAYGIDLISEHIKLVTGDEWDLRGRHSHTAAARFLVADRDGVLDWIGGDSRAAAVSGVAEVKFYFEPKTLIIRKGNYRDTIGHVIASSPSRAQTDATLQRAVDLIDWSISPFPTLGE
ncbi:MULTISPECIES: acetyl-CoA carboxylase biotin carboxylase subunit family protein [unclassified Mesorhizobium]|uniref:ATP-grasp domain-containing protein n=1 Tax=unclassified Mesorhizobium TaxID=325217 RepID=UPI000FD8B699|nr:MULTISPECIES: acetyl-CoA carboxylase biotin carboxylase subunit family protein [unclassified Mesorhizobium]RWE20207.1 MAG: ATP-grasp domain-containing protein [Mesorhizobium sp.]TGQ11354.1 ATP-grasp domain-containing protein [Mesorhizobium sp. M00.F.Ca.ET.217.01.1.1]TGV83801.1 ATP-grasp domain-containing protein [Mesorhizobium sp. M00.F.Ca.ET.158.01.1.1]